MSLCIASAGSIMTLLAGSFSLSWTHSVEKNTWMERWQVEGDRLALVWASVEGSGAGIDLPQDAVWEDGRWTYRPSLPPLTRLNLAASGATVGGWQFCAGGNCQELGARAGEAVSIWVADVCNPAAERDAHRLPDTAAQ
ncbi:DUF1850 domain-containing protein [Devosia naphthalenivorans]|uniref:DUF1850 domain-containing protein n=1 Tax=Devosia naphthalenivorans TaxID=2082392 RepID=UPI000D382C72|nr:DUF1850 domain-containing protein [Devosia naphthalenivorans]